MPRSNGRPAKATGEPYVRRSGRVTRCYHDPIKFMTALVIATVIIAIGSFWSMAADAQI
jgi:hypothetical protein